MIYGGQGADTIWGGAHADTIYGNVGPDVIFAGGGADTGETMMSRIPRVIASLSLNTSSEFAMEALLSGSVSQCLEVLGMTTYKVA